MSEPELKFVYFGGEPIGVPVLETLLTHGLKPGLVVCNPDRPAGRGRKLTPPPVKVLAEQHDIPVFQPESIKKPEAISDITKTDWDLFVVVAYNKIMPEWLIELPEHKTINVHPSLLPLRRGANPIRSSIVENDRASIGISIMLMDKEMDHGPLLAQAAVEISDVKWPMAGPELDTMLAHKGAAILADTIPRWIAGDITATEQDHAKATFTNKVTKSDGELALDPHNLPTGTNAHELLCKIRGCHGWPGTFFTYKNTRVKINDATIENDTLLITEVTPAGKPAQSFEVWLTNQ